MKRYFFAFSVLIFCLIGCLKNTVTIDEVITNKLVIWGKLNGGEDENIILLTHSKPVVGNDSLSWYIEGATVTLFENAIFKENLQELDSGYYRVNSALLTGNTYTIRAIAHGYDTLTTVPDSLPAPIILDSISTQLIAGASDTAGVVKIYIQGKFNEKIIGLKQNGGGVSSSFSPFSCDQYPTIKIFDLTTKNVSCFDSLPYLDFYPGQLTYQQYAVDGVKYGFVFFSSKSQLLLEKLAAFQLLNTDVPGLNLFYEPVYLPELVNGGYGGILFYQPLDTTVFFK